MASDILPFYTGYSVSRIACFTGPHAINFDLSRFGEGNEKIFEHQASKSVSIAVTLFVTGSALDKQNVLSLYALPLSPSRTDLSNLEKIVLRSFSAEPLLLAQHLVDGEVISLSPVQSVGGIKVIVSTVEREASICHLLVKDCEGNTTSIPHRGSFELDLWTVLNEPVSAVSSAGSVIIAKNNLVESIDCRICSVAIHADILTCALGTSTGKVLMRDLNTNSNIGEHCILGGGQPISGLVYLSPSTIAASAGKGVSVIDMRIPDKNVTSLFVDSGNDTMTIASKRHSKNQITCIGGHPNQPDFLATGCAGGLVKIWDIRNEKWPVSVTDAHDGPVSALEFHPYQRDFMFTTGLDGRFLVWDFNSNRDPTITQFMGTNATLSIVQPVKTWSSSLSDLSLEFGGAASLHSSTSEINGLSRGFVFLASRSGTVLIQNLTE